MEGKKSRQYDAFRVEMEINEKIGWKDGSGASRDCHFINFR